MLINELIMLIENLIMQINPIDLNAGFGEVSFSNRERNANKRAQDVIGGVSMG
jgi:hypothetical protein